MNFDLENPLTDLDGRHVSDSVVPLFLGESDHMPSHNYISALQVRDFDLLFRQQAISSISQLSCDFDPLLTYLAVNYLDRFLSSRGIQLNKKWVIKLIAISCVSLATKMLKEAELYLTQFQSNGGIIFDTQTIARMESIILGGLKWRMRSITPLSFIPFFISFFKLKDPPLCQALKTRAIQIIFKAQIDINFLEYKPSIISATALLSASHELFPLQFPSFKQSLANCSHLNREDMSQCYTALQGLVMEEYESSSLCDVVSSSETPVNVLDQRFSWSESEKSGNINNNNINDNNNNIDNANAVILSTSGGERDSKRMKIIMNGHHYT